MSNENVRRKVLEAQSDVVDLLADITQINPESGAFSVVAFELHRIKEYPYCEDIAEHLLREIVTEGNSEHVVIHDVMKAFIETYPTKFTKVTEVDDEGTEIEDIWYQYTSLVLFPFPRSYVDRSVTVWSAMHNTASLEISSPIGVPYGTHARMIMMYIVSNAVKYKAQDVRLGRSMKELVEAIGFQVNYNPGATNDKVKDNLDRLLSTTFTITKTNFITVKEGDEEVMKREVRTDKLLLFKSSTTVSELYSNDHMDDVKHVTLSDEFFETLQNHSMPIPFHLLTQLTRAPLILDVLMYFTYRNNTQRERLMKFEVFAAQMGNTKSIAVFKKDVGRAFKKIKTLWPEFDVHFVKGGNMKIPVMRKLVNERKSIAS